MLQNEWMFLWCTDVWPFKGIKLEGLWVGPGPFLHHVLVFNNTHTGKEKQLHILAWPRAAQSHGEVMKLKWFQISSFVLLSLSVFLLYCPSFSSFPSHFFHIPPLTVYSSACSLIFCVCLMLQQYPHFHKLKEIIIQTFSCLCQSSR